MGIVERLQEAYQNVASKDQAIKDKQDAMLASYNNALAFLKPHMDALNRTVVVEKPGYSRLGFRAYGAGKTDGFYAYKIKVQLLRETTENGKKETHVCNRYRNDSFSVPVEITIGVEVKSADGKNLSVCFGKGKDERNYDMDFRDGQYDAVETALAEWLQYIGSAALIDRFSKTYAEEKQQAKPFDDSRSVPSQKM